MKTANSSQCSPSISGARAAAIAATAGLAFAACFGLAGCALPRWMTEDPDARLYADQLVPPGGQDDVLYRDETAGDGKETLPPATSLPYVSPTAAHANSLLAHPRAASFHHAADALNYEADAIGSLLFPRLTVDGGVGGAYLDDRDAREDDWTERHEARLILRQQLFDGHRISNSRDAARARANAAHAIYRTAGETVAIDFATAFLDLKQAYEIRELARENVGIHREMLAQTADKQERGLRSQADLDLVKSRLKRADALLETQNFALADALARYEAIAGPVPSRLPTPPSAPRDTLASFDPGQSWEVKSAAHNLKSARRDHDAARGLYSPVIGLEVAGRTGDGFTGVSASDEELTALFVVSFDIFDGGFRRAEVERTRSTIHEAEALMDASLLGSEQLWKQGDALRRNALARIDSLDGYVDSLDEAVKALEADFEANRQPVLRMLDLKDELFEARSFLVTERYNRIRAEYAMLAAVGRLAETLDRSSLPIRHPEPKAPAMAPPAHQLPLHASSSPEEAPAAAPTPAFQPAAALTPTPKDADANAQSAVPAPLFGVVPGDDGHGYIVTDPETTAAPELTPDENGENSSPSLFRRLLPLRGKSATSKL